MYPKFRRRSFNKLLRPGSDLASILYKITEHASDDQQLRFLEEKILTQSSSEYEINQTEVRSICS